MEVKARANTKPQKWGNACHNKGAKRPVQKLCSHMPATCVILVFLVATIKKKQEKSISIISFIELSICKIVSFQHTINVKKYEWDSFTFCFSCARAMESALYARLLVHPNLGSIQALSSRCGQWLLQWTEKNWNMGSQEESGKVEVGKRGQSR